MNVTDWLAAAVADAERRGLTELKPLLDFGSPAISQVGPMPYPVVNTMFDEAYPAGLLNYWKSSFMTELSDDAIDAMIDLFPSCPSKTRAA